MRSGNGAGVNNQAQRHGVAVIMRTAARDVGCRGVNQPTSVRSHHVRYATVMEGQDNGIGTWHTRRRRHNGNVFGFGVTNEPGWQQQVMLGQVTGASIPSTHRRSARAAIGSAATAMANPRPQDTTPGDRSRRTGQVVNVVDHACGHGTTRYCWAMSSAANNSELVVVARSGYNNAVAVGQNPTACHPGISQRQLLGQGCHGSMAWVRIRYNGVTSGNKSGDQITVTGWVSKRNVLPRNVRLTLYLRQVSMGRPNVRNQSVRPRSSLGRTSQNGVGNLLNVVNTTAVANNRVWGS